MKLKANEQKHHNPFLFLSEYISNIVNITQVISCSPLLNIHDRSF